MKRSEFDETEFFRAIQRSGARALLIGRRALVALGIHREDIARFNEAVEPMELMPTRTPDEARARGRYVLENGERVDVLVARSVPTTDGLRVAFEDLWERRRLLAVGHAVEVAVPTLEDLILTKRFASRPKDLEDIRLLEVLRSEEPE